MTDPGTSFFSLIFFRSEQTSPTNSGGPGGSAGPTGRVTARPPRWHRGITCLATSLPSFSGGDPFALYAAETFSQTVVFPSFSTTRSALGTTPNGCKVVNPHCSGVAIPGSGKSPSAGTTDATSRLGTTGLAARLPGTVWTTVRVPPTVSVAVGSRFSTSTVCPVVAVATGVPAAFTSTLAPGTSPATCTADIHTVSAESNTGDGSGSGTSTTCSGSGDGSLGPATVFWAAVTFWSMAE